MKLYELYKNVVITEKIYGRNTIVYHRTEIRNLADKLYTQGWKFGDKQTYGPGFYSCYELESINTQKMSNIYGPIIVKFQVTIDNFLIFDYDEFIKSPLGRKLDYTKNSFIHKQLDYFNINYEPLELNITIKNSDDSSVLAKNCLRLYKDIINKVDGLIFTDEYSVGKVLVCYKPNDLIIPISWKSDNSDVWIKVDKNVNYFKQVFNKRNG